MVRIHYHIEQSTPRTDKFFLDSAGGCGLSSAYLLETGKRAATAPVRFAAFLRPALERKAGSGGNTKPARGIPPQLSFAVSSSRLLKPISRKDNEVHHV